MEQKRFYCFCQISLIFSDFEEDLSTNQFDWNFLKAYHEKLMFHLDEVFTVDKSTTEYFPDDDFVYKGRDWWMGGNWNVPLLEQIEYQTKIKIDQEKKKYWVIFFKKTWLFV